LPTLPDVEAMLRTCDQVDQPVVLESSDPSGPYGRYSILTCCPIEVATFQDGRLRDQRGDALQASGGAGLWETLGTLLDATARIESPGGEYGPGWFGYLGYELGRTIEKLPHRARRDTSLPDLRLALHDAVLIIDHHEKRAHIAWLEWPEKPTRGPGFHGLHDWLQRARSARPATPETPWTQMLPPAGCNFSDDAYCQAVARCIEYIAAGDIFQVNLSRRLEVPSPPASCSLYQALRKENPSWYGAYLRLPTSEGEAAICSASPELFLRKRGREVITRPIKGTCRRMGDAEDNRRGQALLASRKDNAELAMIVDLLRNDLGRVCEFHSVRVTEARALEAHPTVQHLVATIQGRLRPTFGEADLLRATFPGGSITGAPKIRAMEIIDEIEPTARGVYTGCIGCSCAGGHSEWNIAIRTIVHTGDVATFGVGGGIVADSQPPHELEETRDKARGLWRAFARACNAAPACRESGI
jgi:para-aminobenzoate synthetase component 1